MRHLVLIAGVMMLMALPALQADPGGMGYGTNMKKSGDMGMEKSGDMGMSQASVEVMSPADGATLSQSEPVTVSYQATTGPKGDHLHIYVNGKREAVLRKLSGSHVLGMLNPGMHKINVEIVTKDHQHIGVGKEISVDVR